MITNYKIVYALMGLFLFAVPLSAQLNLIDLSGDWNVMLDLESQPNVDSAKFNKIEGTIKLPSSLAQQGFGARTIGSDYGILTPEYRFLGEAVFERDIMIPKKWKNKLLIIFLERVLWQSKVFVDGQELSAQDALGTPHYHNLGKLAPGRHRLTIKVDNRMIHNIGDKGHGYGDYTQGIWNGIVGRMVLQAKDPTNIVSIRTFSNIEEDQLKVELKINANESEKAEIELKIHELGDEEIVRKETFQYNLLKGENKKVLLMNLQGKLKKWNEFDPTVYILKAAIKTKEYYDTEETEFGYVKIGHNGTNILINDSPVFLRGNLDCIHFPLTGYPSTKVEDWEKIFKTYKEYGLNHARFHSWCPPEAAFKAANRVGIYLQAEASIWIDWWMSEDMEAKGRPEMDTKGHPKGLGRDPLRDAFVIDEMNRVIDHYGNNPSFTMFCIGNELGNADFGVIKEWVADLKKKDGRRLYAVSTARKITEVDDYMATHYIQGLGRTRGLNGPHTDWDFEEVYSKMDIPIIAHEIGQWPVYPSWNEIDKYKGVFKARNLRKFKEVAVRNGIDDQDEDFKMASGALNQIMYKYETESFLRTKSCAGIQLLSMQDYQGQGEALIGWLDAHWESKGIITPQKFRQHSNETVPLLRTKKFVWTTDEIFEANAQLSHYGNSVIQEGNVSAKIIAANGVVLKEVGWPVRDLAVGSLTDLGKLSLPLDLILNAQRLTITLELENTRFKNNWNIWVYPSKLPKFDDQEIVFADAIDDKTVTALKEGKKVLLVANNLGTGENSVSLAFYPLYWSLTFFPGQGKTSIGMLLKNQHPAFDHFPTSFHSDWQWEAIMKDSKGFILNDMPKEYKPIAQIVDDFHRNNKEGALFEFNVGKGKLLVCGFNIDNSESPVANQLKYSLIEYMKSASFAPTTTVDRRFLEKLFPLIPRAEDANIKQDFRNALLQVNAAFNVKKENESIPWALDKDQILEQKDNVAYMIQSDGVWKDAKGSAWRGKNMRVEIDCPNGILGNFYVLFKDWNDKGREGILEFEGRKVRLGPHNEKEGRWVKFHVMREDSNDGKLILKTKALNGDDLMISQIVLSRD